MPTIAFTGIPRQKGPQKILLELKAIEVGLLLTRSMEISVAPLQADF